MVETAQAVLGPGTETSGLDLLDDKGTRHIDPAVVLVSNNPYALSGPLGRGGRPTLRGGSLGIIVIDRPAAGRAPSSQAWSSASLRIDGPDKVHAGIDGEAVELCAAARSGFGRRLCGSGHPVLGWADDRALGTSRVSAGESNASPKSEETPAGPEIP